MKRLIFFALFSACSIASAAWELINFDSNGKFFQLIDKSTIRKNGEIARIWMMTEYSSVQTDSAGRQYQSSKILYSFNCKNETNAVVSIVEFSDAKAEGSVIYNGTRRDKDLEWDPNVPGSLAEGLWKIACGKK
jgi:hypothetical protein